MSPTPLDYQPCKVPLRRARGAFDVDSIIVHEGILADVWEADRRWRALGGPRFFVIRQADTGSYNCRNSVGHSRGVAIDFNWKSNPYVKPRPSGGCPQQDQMRRFYAECWKPLGYGWGGNWRSACDAMHVSKLRSEGGDGVLYRTWEEEDEMSKTQVDEILRRLDDIEAGVNQALGALYTDEEKPRDRITELDRRIKENRALIQAHAEQTGADPEEFFKRGVEIFAQDLQERLSE